MIAISTYYRGDVEFYDLIDQIEPPKDKNMIDDAELIRQWREHWGPLAKINYDNIMAIKDTKVEDVKDKLEAMRKLFFLNMEKVREM